MTEAWNIRVPAKMIEGRLQLAVEARPVHTC